MSKTSTDQPEGVGMKDAGIGVHGVRYQVKDVTRAVAFGNPIELFEPAR